MKCPKRRKQASSKIKHDEIKRINGMSSGIFKCSLRFIYIHIILFTVFCTSSAVYVEWKATFPAIFGNVTYLHCNISDTASNCTNKDRQWIGGPKYDGLCYEDECPTAKKYKVMKQPRCLYTLMIYNFSESDVNCEYTCLYGASKNRRNLTLDEKKFIYEPRVEDIKEETIEKDSTFNRKINISKIYPKPSCVAYLDVENITDHLQISITKPGFYFTADLQINLPLSSCGKLDVYCYLGDYKINITSKNFDSCQFKGGENSGSTIMLVLIMFTIVIAVSVFMVCIYRKEKLCFNNNNEASRGRAFQLEGGIM